MTYKTQAEIITALLDGKKIQFDEWGKREYAHLVDGFIIDESGRRLSLYFREPRHWREYTEPKWYDNIPDGGVLCWVSDFEDRPSRKNYLSAIHNFIDDQFKTHTGTLWNHATPLTKAEIKEFMERAPE